MRVLDDIFSLRVQNIYKLQLSLPVAVENEDCLSFFDCKIRKMIIVAPVQVPKTQEILEEDDYSPMPEFTSSLKQESKDQEQKIYEIDEPLEEKEELKDDIGSIAAAGADDDLLFDVV